MTTRLIVFGPCDAAYEALREPATADHLVALAAGSTPPRDDIPQSLITSGLVVGAGDGYRTSDRVLRLDRADVSVPARHLAASINAGIDQLRSVPESQGLSWDQVGFTVVAGLLLDLAIGEELCVADAITTGPQESHVWLLAEAEFSFGVHCVYDDTVRTGAGVVWAKGYPEPPGAIYEGLPAHLSTDLDPETRLRLRYLGWLRGDAPDYVTWIRGDQDPITQLARSLTAEVYLPVLAGLGYDRAGLRRHAVARLLMERTVSLLIAEGALTCGPRDLRRVCWRGDNLRLAAAARAGGD